jgi:hypothetical protein
LANHIRDGGAVSGPVGVFGPGGRARDVRSCRAWATAEVRRWHRQVVAAAPSAATGAGYRPAGCGEARCSTAWSRPGPVAVVRRGRWAGDGCGCGRGPAWRRRRRPRCQDRPPARPAHRHTDDAPHRRNVHQDQPTRPQKPPPRTPDRPRGTAPTREANRPSRRRHLPAGTCREEDVRQGARSAATVTPYVDLHPCMCQSPLPAVVHGSSTSPGVFVFFGSRAEASRGAGGPQHVDSLVDTPVHCGRNWVGARAGVWMPQPTGPGAWGAAHVRRRPTPMNRG